MIDEGCFPRLLDLVRGCRETDRRLHRLLLELIYEMSRIEQLRAEDLMQVDDGFVTYLCRLIEAVSDDVNDPYHYPVIRVLVCLPIFNPIQTGPPRADIDVPPPAACFE